MSAPIYCLSYGNDARWRSMSSRFAALGLEARLHAGVGPGDARIAAFDLDPPTRRVWSIAYGHLDMIGRFVDETDVEAGIFCEDDVLIHRYFASLLPMIVDDFRRLGLDTLLLGYLLPFDLKTATHRGFERLRSPNGALDYYTYTDDTWGAQMYVLSRSQAASVLERFAAGYAARSLVEPIAPFSADFLVTKAGRRALVSPPMAIEDGTGNYADLAQAAYHANSFRAHYLPGTYV